MIPPVVYDHQHAITVAAVFTAYAVCMAALTYIARRAHVLALARRAPGQVARAAARYRRGVAYHRSGVHRHARPVEHGHTTTIPDTRKALA